LGAGLVGTLITQLYLTVTLVTFTFTPTYSDVDLERLAPLNECADEYTQFYPLDDTKNPFKTNVFNLTVMGMVV
jgi:hypothetical protein